MIHPDIKHTFKFIVVGSSGVGKTAILRRLIEDKFSSENSPTIGVEYVSAMIDIDGKLVMLQIWDTAGQEKFRSIAKSYFRHAVGVMLLFDLTDRQSFDDLVSWLSDIHHYCDQNACVTLVGNKVDLESSRSVTAAEAQLFGITHQAIYIETSALDGANVSEAFHRATRSVYEKAELGLLNGKPTPPQPDIHPTVEPSGGCCS
jgi:small GTP-binding protein